MFLFFCFLKEVKQIKICLCSLMFCFMEGLDGRFWGIHFFGVIFLVGVALYVQKCVALFHVMLAMVLTEGVKKKKVM